MTAVNFDDVVNRLIYSIKIEVGDSYYTYKYREVPDICELAKELNKIVEENPHDHIVDVKATRNYVEGATVNFFVKEYLDQHFIETYEERLLCAHKGFI